MTDKSDLKELNLQIKNLKNEMRAVRKNKSKTKDKALEQKLKIAQVDYRQLYMKIYSKEYYKLNPEVVIRAVTKYKLSAKGIRSRDKYEQSAKGKARKKLWAKRKKR